jgi:hypothetical protein
VSRFVGDNGEPIRRQTTKGLVSELKPVTLKSVWSGRQKMTGLEEAQGLGRQGPIDYRFRKDGK